MLILIWWLLAWWKLNQLDESAEPQALVIVEEHEREERFTRKALLVLLGLLVAVGILYAIVSSNFEAAHASLRQCEWLLGRGALVETTNCIISSAETLARADVSASWIGTAFWVLLAI